MNNNSVNGLEAKITNYGGIVVSLTVPDRSGKLGDVVLGYDTLNGYIANSPYFGALIGRYGNRIANGRFTIEGVEYQLAQNDNENSLHGGRKGFDKVVWQAERLDTNDRLLYAGLAEGPGDQYAVSQAGVGKTDILKAFMSSCAMNA